MSRTSLNVLVFIALIACSPSVVASESDQDTLRQELAELKTMAAELLERIEGIESQLEPESVDLKFVAGETVVVEIVRSRNMLPQIGPPTKNPTNEPLSQNVTAKVLEVRPNGDLVLEGQRRIMNDVVRREETITGVVHQDRVDEARHVKAEAIRDLRIRVQQEIVGQPASRP